MRSGLRAIAREPLVHFVVIGALLFAVEGWRGGEAEPPAPDRPPASGPADRSILVDDELRATLRDGLRRAGAAEPDAAAVDQAVARWIDEEVLYREGLARGLDRDDPAVRKRVAEKMALILDRAIVIAPPTERELRAWFEERRDRWARPPRLDFTHVFVTGEGPEAERRAADLLARLAAGAAPELLGDRFSGGQRYRGRKPVDLAASFGPEFAAGLDRQPAGAWRLRRSRHGLHLVRVDRFTPGGAADFAAARADVDKEWRDARRAEAMAARLRQLRAGWQVVER